MSQYLDDALAGLGVGKSEELNQYNYSGFPKR